MKRIFKYIFTIIFVIFFIGNQCKVEVQASDTEIQCEMEEDKAYNYEWYNDYEYELLDGKIILKNYIGVDTDIFVPKCAEIDGNKYQTVIGVKKGILSSKCSIWRNDNNSIETIEFEEGLLFPQDSSYLFSELDNLQSIKLQGVDTSNVTDMSRMFTRCNTITNVDLDGLDTSNVTSMSGMFQYCTKLATVNLKGLDTGNVTDMGEMFECCDGLIKIDLSGLNTSNVKNMHGMFGHCYSLNSIGLKGLDTHNVINMAGMFAQCIRLQSIDLSDFDTDNVEKMGEMFRACGVTMLDLGSFDTSNVTEMQRMFQKCTNLSYINLKSFDTRNVIYMSGMFERCYSLTSLDLSSFDTSNVKEMNSIFYYCNSLETIYTPSKHILSGVALPMELYDEYGNSYNEIPNYYEYSLKLVKEGKWKKYWTNDYDYELKNGQIVLNNYIGTDVDIFVPKVAMINGMKYQTTIGKKSEAGSGSNCSIWKNENVSISSIEFEKGFIFPSDSSALFSGLKELKSIKMQEVDTSNVVDMSEMFMECRGLSNIDFSSFDTLNVTNMEGMFYGCSGLTSLDLSFFNTCNVKDMCYMLWGCRALDNLNLNGIDTRNVKYMYFMFSGCSSLTSLDLSSFDTSKVENMCVMFSGCNSLTSLDLSGFDTSNVKDMGSMFKGCYALESLNIQGFDTSNVTDMSDMFRGCSSLEYLDINNLRTDNVSNMCGMFYGCKIKTIDLKNFDTSNVQYMDDMFRDCDMLTILDISGFDTGNVIDMRNMFNGCKSLTMLDISGFEINDDMKAFRMRDMFNQCESLGIIYTPRKHLLEGIKLPAEFFDEDGNKYTELPTCLDGSKKISKNKKTLYFNGWVFENNQWIYYFDGKENQYNTKFHDIQDGTKFYFGPVYWAYEKGITTGTSNTTFDPNEDCTRAQIVTFLWRLMGSPEPKTKANFSDMEDGAYYVKAVSWAAENGITTGLKDKANRFGVNQSCTREMCVTFLWRAAGEPKVSGTKTGFKDVEKGKYYYDAVNWATKMGITQGVDSVHFGVTKTCTRAMIVTFMYRYAEPN